MREFQQRRRIKKSLHSRYAILFLAVITFFLIQGVWGVYIKHEKSKVFVEKARADLETLENREKSLVKSISALNTEEGKEREFRDRFGVIKEGENMVILVSDTEQTKPSANVLNDSWWDRFLDAIGF